MMNNDDIRLKDLRSLAYTYARKISVKMDDGEIYELRPDGLYGEPQNAIIGSVNHEIRMKKPLVANWKKIKTIKVGQKLVAERRDGKLKLRN